MADHEDDQDSPFDHHQPVSIAEELRSRRRRRAELLVQRERAAEARRQRGYVLRSPSSQPLILLGSQRPHLR